MAGGQRAQAGKEGFIGSEKRRGVAHIIAVEVKYPPKHMTSPKEPHSDRQGNQWPQADPQPIVGQTSAATIGTTTTTESR